MRESRAPEEILQSYYPDGTEEEVLLADGIVNTTLLVTDTEGQKSILQRLHPAFDETMADDYEVISAHLRSEGWEVAIALRSPAGQAYIPDSTGNIWRAFTYTESDGVVPPVSISVGESLSDLLGKLHQSLRKLDYEPRFLLPHFHDTDHYASRLEALLHRLTDREIRNLGTNCIKLAKENPMPAEPTQLIHGDPKMTNALYRNGLPFTFIDFDTLAHTNPLIDVGDMLRSIVGKLLAKDPNFMAIETEPIVLAYYDAADLSEDKEMFLQRAISAGQVMALELGIRYLVDVVEDSYFMWDNQQFESRREHNIARAQTQWQTLEALRT